MAQIPRIYLDQAISIDATVDLDSQASQHVSKVLRLAIGDTIQLFNGKDGDVLAEIIEASKKTTTVKITEQLLPQQAMPLHSHLGQVISKGDRMEYTIQKATELGICEITPLWSERCEVKLKGDRLEKKLDQWRKIAISSCEQNGRNQLPIIHSPMNYDEWAKQINQQKQSEITANFVLHPHPNPEQQVQLKDFNNVQHVNLLIGPEGGFSGSEVQQAVNEEFDYLTLGPRVFRTETASVAALSVMQYLWGDF